MLIILRWVFILTLIFTQLIAKGADNYAVGDTLYVWAESGLNLREAPGAKELKTGGVMFGDFVIVAEKTEIPFNVEGITYFDEDDPSRSGDPVILYGNWVKVKTEAGNIGYVIDQYLLPIKPVSRTVVGRVSVLPLALLNTDTVFAKEKNEKSGKPNYSINQRYDGDVKVRLEYEGSGSLEVYQFYGRSIEEVLVILSVSDYRPEKVRVERYWPDELILRFGSCEYKITKVDEVVRVVLDCPS